MCTTIYAIAAAAKSLQSCPTLCDPTDGSPAGSPVPGILQARTLEWVAISFSSAWKWKVKVKSLSRVQPSAIPWTAAFQAPPSMGFSKQEYWSGVPTPSPSLLLGLIIILLIFCHYLYYYYFIEFLPLSLLFFLLSSVQSLSHVRLFAAPWTAAHQASLVIINSQGLLNHVHWVGDAIQPPHPLSSPSPPPLNLSHHQGLFFLFFFYILFLNFT